MDEVCLVVSPFAGLLQVLVDLFWLVSVANCQKINQVVVSRALKHFTGLDLIVEADPHNGLRLAAEKLPDLILLDIMLPQLSGFEVIERLRAEPGTRHIPVVALSANAMPEDMEKAKAAGFDDYLAKPVDIFSLRRVIKQYFQQKAA